MKLYIQIKDGKPFEHPIFEDNFREVFSDIDPNNLPPEFAQFVRVNPPTAGLYKVVQSAGYEFKDGVWTDVYQERDMTQEEKKAVQNPIKEAWERLPNRDNFAAWTYDEVSNAYQPPIPRPESVDGKVVRWCGADNNWKETPARPIDGKNYMFNYITWTWEIA